MKKNNNKYLKTSFILNIIVTALTLATIIMAITKFKFMKEYDSSSGISNAKFFSYFTTQSNVFMGIVSFAFAIKEYKILKGIEKEIPLKYYVLKLVAVTAVGLTFFIVFAFFSYKTEGGALALLRNKNLFFHLIIPVISMINYLLFENTDKIKFKYTFYGLLPTFLYEIYYTINLLSHMENGKIPLKYDWYAFLQNGMLASIIVAPLMLGITYLITFVFWIANKTKGNQLEEM